MRAYGYHNPDREPTRLREDFAGGAAIAGAFVAMEEDHRALAVEIDPATAAWAREQFAMEHADRLSDLQVVTADVLALSRPKVDLTCALNFSAFIYHRRVELLGYFRAVRRGLRRGGVLVMDVFGGPGAHRVGVQSREFEAAIPPGMAWNRPGAMAKVTYFWEQKSFDAATNRIDCRISFKTADQILLNDAFVYDWRLWSPAELTELLSEAGFTSITVWCDSYDPTTGQSDGVYQPIDHLPEREDWIAYISARR